MKAIKALFRRLFNIKTDYQKFIESSELGVWTTSSTPKAWPEVESSDDFSVWANLNMSDEPPTWKPVGLDGPTRKVPSTHLIADMSDEPLSFTKPISVDLGEAPDLTYSKSENTDN